MVLCVGQCISAFCNVLLQQNTHVQIAVILRDKQHKVNYVGWCWLPEVYIDPKLVKRISTQYAVPCHVAAGQATRNVLPSFDHLLHAQLQRYNDLEESTKAANITFTCTVRGHAFVSVVPFVIDVTVVLSLFVRSMTQL